MPLTHSPVADSTAERVAALRPHAPFAAMSKADVERLARASRLVYFAPGDTILAPGPHRPQHCYAIKQGSVRGERPDTEGPDAALWELSAGEMFPLGALLGERGTTSAYRAAQDTFCLVFPAAEFDALMARSPEFRDFCTRRLAYLLDVVRASVQAEYAGSITTRHDMNAPLARLARSVPVTATPEMGIGEALGTMEARHIGCLPVVNADGRPIGIFTRHDVIGRVVLPQRNLGTAVHEVMTSPPITLSAGATAADAAILMSQRGIRHVIVTEADGRLSGIVSERDLFRLDRRSEHELSSAVGRASDLPTLVQCAADIRALSHALVAQGVASGPLTRMVSGLNDRLAVRVLELVKGGFDLSGLVVCWLALGSEGRGEQTIATDQDNAIVFVSEDPDAPEEAGRERLLPFAHAANEALDRCGYPLCAGDVMAGNPRYCRSLSEWQATFAQWIERSDPQALLAASICFDFRPLWGASELAEAMRADVARLALAYPRFLKQLADNARRHRPPLSWRGEIVESEDIVGGEGIDVKFYGSMPIIDGARIFALAAGVTATGTIARLREAGPRLHIADSDLANWCDAFEYLQMLRLRTQYRRSGHELPPAANPNLVPVASLSALDRRVLKEALRQVRKLQQRLALDYP
jgi:CBS domain-containing protein